MSNDKIWRTCLYLRISKEDGDKDESESITNQRSLLLAHAEKLPGVAVVSTKIDDGWSGANFQRPAFTEMMGEIRSGLVDCVLVKDLTRFGRNFGEAGKYIEHVFPFMGVRFISVNDGIDSADKSARGGDIVIPFLNLISDAYCQDISIKIRSQLDIKRKKGDFVGAFAVFGYKRDAADSNRLVVDAPAANIIRLIYRWKLDGQSAASIAKKLNSLGIASPMAHKKAQGLNFSTPFALSAETKWSAMAVFRILKDETYTGTLIQGKISTPNHKIRKKFPKPVADWARVRGTHEAVISAGDFKLVQDLLKRDTRISPKDAELLYPFSGMARCGQCGENIIRKTSRSNGKAYVYLVCCRRCKGCRVKEDFLAECVRLALQSHIDHIMNLDRILRFIVGLEEDNARELNGCIAAKRADIERYEALLMSLYEHLQGGIISDTEYHQMKIRYNALHADAQQAISNLSREITGIESAGGEKSRWIERFRKHQDFAGLTRRMVVSLVDTITIYPGNRLDMLFRYHLPVKETV